MSDNDTIGLPDTGATVIVPDTETLDRAGRLLYELDQILEHADPPVKLAGFKPRDA